VVRQCKNIRGRGSVPCCLALCAPRSCGAFGQLRCSHGKRLYAQLLSLASVAHGLTVQPLAVSHHHEQRRLVRQQVRVAGATGPTAAVAATAVGGTFVRVYRAGKQCFQSAAVVGGGAEPHWDESAFVPVGGYGDALRQPIRVELCVRGSAGGEEAVAFGEVSIETLGFGECREVSCCCCHRPLLSLVSTLMWLPALPRVVRRCRLCDPLRARVPVVYITRRAPSALCVHHTACSIALCEHHMACSKCSFQLAMTLRTSPPAGEPVSGGTRRWPPSASSRSTTGVAADVS
jgi:hypothetical protein